MIKYKYIISLLMVATLFGCDSEKGGESPAGETPAGENPAGENPAGENPAGENPAGENPAGDDPAGETPAGETPAGETPAGETPAGETPAGEPPAGEDPAGEPPAGETPAGETPAGEPPAGETPAGEEPAGEESLISPARLEVEDQLLESPYNSITIKLASLPSDAIAMGTVEIKLWDGASAGDTQATIELEAAQTLEFATVALPERLVGTQNFVAQLTDSEGATILEANGEPLQVIFNVTGDLEIPVVSVESQQLDPENLYGVVVSNVVIPERYERGLWLAFYEDDAGERGSLLGKERFEAGETINTPVDLDSRILKKQNIHVVFKRGTRTGSWSSTSEDITNLDGVAITSMFNVDATVFHPILEVEDQTLETENVIRQDITIKKVVIPQEFFYGWVALYADDNGQPGELLGRRQYSRGTVENTCEEGVCQSGCGCTQIELSRNLEGEQDVHALLFNGQRWDDAQETPMFGVDGEQIRITFKIGATDLSYLRTPPITTTNPRFVTVERAYSYHKMAWIVLARDDNGQPGRIIAQRRVPYRYAGRVHFTQHSLGSGTICDSGLRCPGQFLRKGSSSEYLTTNYPDLATDPEFYRYTVRGDENLHVLMFEDDPQDNMFTWTPGSTEDVPVLNAAGEPVVSRLQVTVRSAIDNSQKDSSRYYWPCPLSQHYENPTILPVDCRCHTNEVGLDFPECGIIIAKYLNMQYGEGPRAREHNFGHYRSGFSNPSTHELIGLLVWKDNMTVWPENQTTLDVGAVIAIDPDTRDRRVISGRYVDPQNGIQTIGSGPVLAYPFEIQPGPDGKYYVATYNYVRIDNSLTPTVDIIRVDPMTGDRTMVWRSNHLGYNFDNQPNPYGHCANGRNGERYRYYSVQVGRKAFGIDEEGNFYLSYAHNGNTPTSDGIGIIKIGADGSTCDFVTRTKTGINNPLYQGVNIGTGPEPQAGPYKGMLVRNGKLYVSTQLDDDLYEVDIATGNRVALHTEDQDNVTGGSGTHVLWDPYRDLIWQMGFSNAVLLYDPATTDVTPLGCEIWYRDYKGINCKQLAAIGNNGFLLERGGWFHPSDPNIFFMVNALAIMRLDLASGNSDIFSF